MFGGAGKLSDESGDESWENAVAFLAFDAGNPNSILSCVGAARENARSVRGVITSEIWEQINRFHLMVRAGAASQAAFSAPHDFLREVKVASHLYEGITDSTMSHGEGWHFGHAGRLLERADMTCRTLSAMFPTLMAGGTEDEPDEIGWSALLNSTSAFEMYRQRYGRISPRDVIEFLTFDSEFPRAIGYCIASAHDSLKAINSANPSQAGNPAETRLARLRSQLSASDVDVMIVNGLFGSILDIENALVAAGTAINETFFASPVPGAGENAATAAE